MNATIPHYFSSACNVQIYFVSHSLHHVVIATFAGWLFLQVAYFGSVLFLIWRSGCEQRDAQRSEHFGNARQFAIGRKSIIKE
ncbi:exopolysaccharide production repressor protein